MRLAADCLVNMASGDDGAGKPLRRQISDVLFPSDEPVITKALKGAFTTLKKVMSLSGVTLTEVHDDDESFGQPSGAEVFFDESNCDPRLKGLSLEEALAKSRSLVAEDAAKGVAQSVRTAMSFGELEMSEILRDSSAGPSRISSGEIDADYSAPSSSTGTPGGSTGSTSYNIV